MAIEAFNCTCLTIDKECRRKVERPTLFFMPHLPFYLFDNVLEANWNPDNLNKIIILGNTFSDCMVNTSKIKLVLTKPHMLRQIPLPETAIKTWRPHPPPRPVTRMISSIDPDKVYMRAFQSISWHFFGVGKIRSVIPANHHSQKCHPC